MGMYSFPAVDASVWVEFEEGDPGSPLWSGCFRGAAEQPSYDLSSMVLQTEGGNGIVISDAPGSKGRIIIKSTTGASITLNDEGISIQNGKGASITMTGSTVDTNKGG
jgi:uncharacterized protein involved in type VI secretion and phage assembly